jgi:hypothetical protein
LEVVEVCVPEQWLVYQSLLSRMERIYYFDLPQRYTSLAEKHPTLIQIRQFAQSFTEIDPQPSHRGMEMRVGAGWSFPATRQG